MTIEYVEFWAISWKIDILSITALLKFKSKSLFALYATHIIVIICCTPYFVSTQSIFSEMHIWLPKFALGTENHLVLLKDRFLKEILSTEQKTIAFFPVKYGLK